MGVQIPGKNDDIRHRFWEEIFKEVNAKYNKNIILIGDFNAADKTDTKDWKPAYADGANKIKCLRKKGFIDAYDAHIKGLSSDDRYTYYIKDDSGRRLDYAFLSPNLKLVDAKHMHDVRADYKLSDHSMLILEIDN